MGKLKDFHTKEKKKSTKPHFGYLSLKQHLYVVFCISVVVPGQGKCIKVKADLDQDVCQLTFDNSVEMKLALRYEVKHEVGLSGMPIFFPSCKAY